MRVDSSLKAYTVLEKWMDTEVEEFWVLALNSDLKLIEKKLLFRGTVDRCLIHPRDVIRFLCAQNATSFVIAHNHPSGDSRPSIYDIEITKRLFYLSRLTEIQMNDHLILTKTNYYSFADNGKIEKLRKLKSLSLRF